MLLSTELDQRARKRDDRLRRLTYGAPINVFFSLRFNQGLTFEDLAKQAHVDRKALSRLEDGLYTNPLPSVIQFWVRKGLATEGELIEDYADFQFAQRRCHRLYFGPDLAVDHYDRVHLFRQLRARRPSMADPNVLLPVGILEACRALCVPIDTVQHFEKKWRSQQTVPRTIKAALNQCGYSTNQISVFETNYRIWREHQLANNKVVAS